MRFYTEYTSTFARGILCLFKCNKCNIYDISNIKRFPSLEEFYYWGLLKKIDNMHHIWEFVLFLFLFFNIHTSTYSVPFAHNG